MSSIELTDPKIVRYAQRGFKHYLAEGDARGRARDKAITQALAKLWRRKPLNMNDPRNMARYGSQFAYLQRLVVGGEI